MSHLIFTLAQFIFILWPLFIMTALLYSFQSTPDGRRSRRARQVKASLAALGGRIRRNLILTWAFLLVVWVVSKFASSPTPSLVPEPWNTIAFLGGFGVLVLLEAARLGLFRSRVLARVNLHRARDIADLQAMDPYDFEGLITETYRALGYSVQHVGHSGDHGIDVELRTPQGEHWIVQCKRYRDTVGESIIRDLYGTLVSDQAQRAVLVTTAEITQPARAWAANKPIELVDGAALLDLIATARERTEGNWFDRLAHALAHLLLLPPVSQPVQADALPQSQPLILYGAGSGLGHAVANSEVTAAPHANGRVQYLRGVPVCPNCHLPMVARPPRPGEHPLHLLYRCRNYPTCRVTLEHERV